jgi:hypothetical protein
LPDLDQLVQRGFLQGTTRSAAYALISRAELMIARYLRNEKVSPELSSRQEEIRDAGHDLDHAIEHEIESQMEAEAPGG